MSLERLRTVHREIRKIHKGHHVQMTVSLVEWPSLRYAIPVAMESTSGGGVKFMRPTLQTQLT